MYWGEISDTRDKVNIRQRQKEHRSSICAKKHSQEGNNYYSNTFTSTSQKGAASSKLLILCSVSSIIISAMISTFFLESLFWLLLDRQNVSFDPLKFGRFHDPSLR